MAQLGVTYRMRLRPHGEPEADWLLLGDLDGAGQNLVDLLPAAFADVDHQANVEGHQDPQPSVTFDHPLKMRADIHAGAVFRHREYGSRGVLNRADQRDAVPFTERDNQQVQIGAVASASPGAQVGFLALQVANGRSIKTGLERDVRRWLRENADLFLDLTPVAPTEAVEAAIANGGLGPVTFRKLEEPADMFANEVDWWSEGDELGVAEYRLRPARNQRFPGGKLLRYVQTLRGTLPSEEDPVEFPELAAFDAHEYDQLAVELILHGRTKTVYFDQGGASMSHAFSWELDLAPGADDQQLHDALVGILPSGN